jgi:hypothetical protein
MKNLKFILLLLPFMLASCESVSVSADYDKGTNFLKYKTYAFDNFAIARVPLSDFDKKRMLSAIDEGMALKGFTKSDAPDLLVGISTRARTEISINRSGGFVGPGGMGMGGGGIDSINKNLVGTLFIDFTDAKTKELFWQGEGKGYLKENISEKDEKIKEFVSKILAQYPPGKK